MHKVRESDLVTNHCFLAQKRNTPSLKAQDKKYGPIYVAWKLQHEKQKSSVFPNTISKQMTTAEKDQQHNNQRGNVLHFYCQQSVVSLSSSLCETIHYTNYI